MKIRWLLPLLMTACLFAQEPLTTETILKLVKAGIGEDTIVGMVNQQPGKYALSADDIITLKNAGVSDKILAAMVVRNGAGSVPPPSNAVTSNTPPNPAPQQTNSPQPAHPNDGVTRVYITDSQSWEMRGGWAAGGNRNGWGGSGYEAGGARPQTGEIIKTFNQRCPEVTVTNSIQKADFAVTLDHEGGKGDLHRHNKIVVFNRDGDDIFSDSTRALGSSVKDACEAILSHTASHRPNAAAAPGNAPAGAVDVSFTSTPPNAVVIIDGMAIGRTPFTTKLPPDTYKATFTVSGYLDSTYQVTVAPGYPATLNATLKANTITADDTKGHTDTKSLMLELK